MVGYRPVEDEDTRKRRAAELNQARELEVYAVRHMVGPTGSVVRDPDQPGRVIDPYEGETSVGRCDGRCGRASVRRRAVLDDEVGVVHLCDPCLLEDQR